MFTKKVPLLYAILAAFVGIASTYLIVSSSIKRTSEATNESVTAITNDCSYNITRIGGFKYISPLLAAEPECESGKYAGIKNEIKAYIDNEEKDGVVTSVSMYLRDFSKADWTSINATQKYLPGSLLKVGILVTWLRMAEHNPGLLNKEMTYRSPKGFVFPIEHYRSDTVVDGCKYKISDLLKSMIVNSDNRATLFLENQMDTNVFKKEFADLGMETPRFDNDNYMVNVQEYSMIMKALYNSTYLDPDASEYAFTLLSGSDFKMGLVKELPDSVRVAHKFGEAGDSRIHELHETGIIYLHNNPYLLTVMTQGYDWDRLSAVLSHISKIVYDDMPITPLAKK